MGSPFDREVSDEWRDREESGDPPQSDDEYEWRKECEDDLGYAEQYDDDGNEIK